MITLLELFLYPPMAFARIGSGNTPLEAYMWSDCDDAVKGTGKTTIQPVPTILISEEGNVKLQTFKEVKFKEIIDDVEVFKPVCPWFELFARVQRDNDITEEPLTQALLDELKLSLTDVTWKVHLANHKSFHMTLAESDKIEGILETHAATTTKQAIWGMTPTQSAESIIPEKNLFLLAHFQAAIPNDELPGIRARIYPPKGLIYGPKGVYEKIDFFVSKPDYDPKLNALDYDMDNWKILNIPEERLVVNPASVWATTVMDFNKTIDNRTSPGQLFAYVQYPEGFFNVLGIIDDVSDGIISCSIPSLGLNASARIVITPQAFAPDRRHPVSLADNLKDRVDRNKLTEHCSSLSEQELLIQIHDLFERVYETMSAVNLDAMNTKPGFNYPDDTKPVFPPITTVASLKLPLTEYARQKHRRMISYEILEETFRENDGRTKVGSEPGYEELITIYEKMKKIADILNKPPELDGTVGKGNQRSRMPALMRGSDEKPFHITRYQYEIMQYWIEQINPKIK